MAKVTKIWSHWRKVAEVGKSNEKWIKDAEMVKRGESKHN